MSAAVARPARQQAAAVQAVLTQLGALRSLTFTGVGPAGPDVYQATFDKGTQGWWISLDPEGRVDLLRYVPTAPPK